MGKIRHIALATKDPDATAKFYKEAFGLTEEAKFDTPLGHGYALSDGSINLTIVEFLGVDQLGKGMDYVGLHHIGFLVDDTKKVGDKMVGLGAKPFMPRADGEKDDGGFEVKHRGPDGVVIDISEHPWPGVAPLSKEAAE